MIKNVNIGKLKLAGNLILAPMAGVTNLPFRLLCKEYGASLVYSEMVFSDGIIWQNQKSMERCATCPEERPMGIQLSGSDAGTLVNSAHIVVKKYSPELIDMNLGCPARNVIKKGCGSELLKRPERTEEIIKELSGSLRVPITAKIRVLNTCEETLKIARLIEKAGASALIVHGRTQKQKYSGHSNLDIIRSIKNELSIPVIANGNIINEITACHVLDYTGCDGLMIGRAAIGTPHIFKRIKHYIDKGELLPTQTFEEQLDDFLEYVSLCREHGMLDFKDIKVKAQWSTKNMENGRSVRERLNKAKDVGSVLRVMEGLAVNDQMIS